MSKLKVTSTTALATASEPLKISGSHQEREDRAQRLATMFIGEMIPLLVQVRQDFMDKERAETICGVKTFTEYCTGVLRYSESHVRNLIKGQNPASDKHDGSAKRKPLPPAAPVAVQPEPTQPIIDVEFVDASEPQPAEAPLSVQDVLDWSNTDDERFNEVHITKHRGFHNDAGDWLDLRIHANYPPIAPATIKKVVEYFFQLRAAEPIPPEAPQPPSEPIPPTDIANAPVDYSTMTLAEIQATPEMIAWNAGADPDPRPPEMTERYLAELHRLYTCTATTKKGVPCQSTYGRIQDGFCPTHHPARISERQATAKIRKFKSDFGYAYEAPLDAIAFTDDDASSGREPTPDEKRAALAAACVKFKLTHANGLQILDDSCGVSNEDLAILREPPTEPSPTEPEPPDDLPRVYCGSVTQEKAAERAVRKKERAALKVATQELREAERAVKLIDRQIKRDDKAGKLELAKMERATIKATKDAHKATCAAVKPIRLQVELNALRKEWAKEVPPPSPLSIRYAFNGACSQAETSIAAGRRMLTNSEHISDEVRQAFSIPAVLGSRW